MAKYDIGPKIGIEGEKEFRDQITQISQKMRTLDTELEATASDFKRQADAQQKAAEKADGLRKKIELQNEKLATQREALEKASEEYDENSSVVQRWQQVVNKSQTELNKMERELAETEEEARKLGNTLESAGGKIQQFGTKVSNFGGKLTTYVTAPLLAAAAASFKFASDLEENINKTSVAFGENADDVLAWSENTLKQFGLAKSTALEMASLFGDMGTSMGLPLDQSTEMSKTLVGLGADLASFKNISIEQASNALKSIFTGETESLKTLGVVMTETNLEAYAMAEGIAKPYKEMSQAEKVTLRYQYVLDKTKNAQGDFSRTFEGAANQMRIAQESAKELAAEFGENLLPVGNKLLKFANGALEAFGDLDEETQDLIISVGLLAAGIGPVLKVGGNLITAGGKIVKLIGKLTAGTEKFTTASNGLLKVLGGSVGIVGAFSAIAVAGIAALAIYEEYTSLEGAHRREVNKTIDAIKEEAAEIENIKSAREDAIKNSESEFSYYRNLYDELQSIVDANGKVKEGYESRADFITGALGEAYGVEMNIVDGVIQKYDELKQSIEDSMMMTRAENLLGAQEEGYTNALQSLDAERGNAEKITQEIIALQNDIQAWNRQMGELYVGEGQYNSLATKIGNARIRLNELEGAYKTAEGNISEYQRQIIIYEATSSALRQGNYKEAVELSNSLLEVETENNLTVEQARQKELEAEKANLEELKRIYAETQSDTVKTMITASQQRIAELEKALSQEKSSYKKAGANSVNSYVSGMEEAVKNVLGKAQSVGEKIAASFNRGVQTASFVDSRTGTQPSGKSGNTTTLNQTNNFYSPTALTPAETARLNRNNTRETIRSMS